MLYAGGPLIHRRTRVLLVSQSPRRRRVILVGQRNATWRGGRKQTARQQGRKLLGTGDHLRRAYDERVCAGLCVGKLVGVYVVCIENAASGPKRCVRGKHK